MEGDRMAPRKQPQNDIGQNASTQSKEQGAEASLNHDEAVRNAGLPVNAPTSGHTDGEVFNEARSSSQKEEVPEKNGSRLKNAWVKTGLNPGMLIMMFKGSVAPIIGVAFYEADSVATTFSTLGYLIPIITILCLPIMPRAKYLQNLVLNTSGICIGSAIALLGIWTGIKARENTTAPGSTAAYNSSQSAVCAIWLFFNIYSVNYLRAKFSALSIPVILYGIFTNVAFTYGPLFSTIAQGEALIKQLLTGFLTAFGLATGVHLIIVPMSCRQVVFKSLEGYFGAIRGALKAQTAYLQSLESSDMFTPIDITDESDTKKKTKNNDGKKKTPHTQTPQAEALKAAIEGLKGLHGRLVGDLPFAKRETAWGKLDAKDLDEIFTFMRSILIPLVGLSTIVDIFERTAERRGWVHATRSKYEETDKWQEVDLKEKENEKRVWNEMMKTMHEPFAIAVEAMDQGLEHAAILLELTAPPKKKERDIEENASEDPKPGELQFGEYLEKRMKEFYGKRGQTLKTWAREKGLSEEQFDSMNASPVTEDYSQPEEKKHHRDQQQLYIILYLEFLLYSVGLAISNLIKFAEKKVEDGTMKKNRLILPGQKRLKKWIMSVGQEGSSVDTESADSIGTETHNVYMGSGFGPKKDPEHLPPNTAWQHFGNGLRVIPRILGSAESAFGFRCACATMSIGIMAYLKNSHVFFTEQRLVWAMFMIAIGMTPTSGQSTFGFIGRVLGTAIAMVTSIIIWYLPNEHTPGVIVFLWLFIFVEMYFFLKYPRHTAIWLICIVTQILIVGYELQVRKIGQKAATSSGQPYYPIYILSPYRLASVAAGCLIGFIWTIFPYPITDRSWLRRDLGSTLYILTNFHAVVHSTIRARMDGTEGNMDLKTSPGRRLDHVRHKIFGKLLILLPSLQQHAEWEKWEPNFGGKFPRETYENIILRATNIMNYLSLISYATQSWSTGNETLNTLSPESRKWVNDLSAVVSRLSPTSHSLTSTLTLLSTSITQGQPLPPYLQLPASFNLTKRLEALDKGILDARHVEEPGYSAYAVMQVASSLVVDDLSKLVDAVRDLVGEADFGFVVEEMDAGGKERKMD